MFKTLKRLLPGGEAWRMETGTQTRALFEALATLGDDFKVYADTVWGSIFPTDTDQITAWEREFGIVDAGGLTDAERRERLQGRWAAAGGQSAAYIKQVLDAAGFSQLFVHEWWADMADPPTPRDPLVALSGGTATAQFGDSGAQFGDSGAQFGDVQALDRGYWLVNNTFDPIRYPIRTSVDAGGGSQFGDVGTQFGDVVTQFGPGAGGALDVRAQYLYIGGQTWPDVATVPHTQKKELETLLFKTCPTHLWLVLLVEYN